MSVNLIIKSKFLLFMKVEAKENIFKIIYIVFFINAILEIVAEYFAYKPFIYVSKPLIPILIMGLYWFSSTVKSYLFFLILILSAITNLLFIPSSEKFLFFGIIAFTIQRVLMLIYIFKKVFTFNYKIFMLATIPIISVFYYLFIESSNVPENSYFILLFQIILIALFVGVALSNYIKDDTVQNTYLMISALLFTGLQLVIYTEKYFLPAEDFSLLRPIAMSLNVIAFLSFYKFITVTEDIKLQK